MYFVVSVLVFFCLPPVGATMLIVGAAVNLLINAVDYMHQLKRTKRLSVRNLANYH